MRKNPVQELYHERYHCIGSGILPEMMRIALNVSDSYYEYVEHRHDDHEIIYVVDGIYRARLNGHEICLSSGDALIVCPQDLHFDAIYPNLRFYAVNFYLSSDLIIDKELRFLRKGIGPEKQIIRDCPKVLKNDFNSVISLAGDKNSLPKICANFLRIIFWRIVNQIPINSLSRDMAIEVSGNSFSATLSRAISDNIYSSSLTVKELSSLMSMSASKLSSLCAECLGTSPGRIVLEMRINVAKRLLAQTDMNIKEISSLLNFSDQFTFSRAFKRCQGEPPNEYRKQLNNQKTINLGGIRLGPRQAP